MGYMDYTSVTQSLNEKELSDISGL
jgi:hypothetical protein